jgi:hypothetical protein
MSVPFHFCIQVRCYDCEVEGGLCACGKRHESRVAVVITLKAFFVDDFSDLQLCAFRSPVMMKGFGSCLISLLSWLLLTASFGRMYSEQIVIVLLSLTFTAIAFSFDLMLIFFCFRVISYQYSHSMFCSVRFYCFGVSGVTP